MRFRYLTVCVVLLVAACQPDPTLTQNGRLIAERTLDPDEALPTLFLPPTNTPVIVPTSAPTSVAQAAPTEIEEIQIATAQNDFILITPTLQPSKTPSVTPTQTAEPTITTTPTITVTAPPTATSSQFSFRGEGSSSAAEATAYALNLQQQQQRAAESNQQQTFSSQNAFVPQTAPSSFENAPASNCIGGTEWFFAGLSTATCPTGAADSSNAAFQRFQYGYMFWLQDTNQIYALYVTNEPPRWTTHPNLWNDGMEECSGERAASFANVQAWEPIQGFCMAWRQDSRMQARIGYAEDRYEYSYIARYQVGEEDTIAIEDNIGNVFYLGPQGQWDLWRRGF